MADNRWKQPKNPPPPLFLGEKERNLVKQANDELIERVIGQPILYFPIDLARTNFHVLYGEAVKKTFLPPVMVYALVAWEGQTTQTDRFGVDRRSALTIHFHKRRLTEDQNLFVREGDFIQFEKLYYEIVTLTEPKLLFGQEDHKVEIAAKCIRARKGVFNAK